VSPKALLIGLDCASPELVLEHWRDELPVISGLLRGATFGPLRSVHPPITIPAWASMMTGRDPGELGIYGFRSRQDRTYTRPVMNDARALRAPALWDLLGDAGLRSVVIGFPPSFPPRPFPGMMVTGMLTPPTAKTFTSPEALSDDVREWVGRYLFDTTAHRQGDTERLVEEVFAMTRVRFRVARELLKREVWSFGFLHEIGLDRIQHALWGSLDDPESAGYGKLLDYHRLLDQEIGELLEGLSEETVILIASDHGAQPLEGSFAINQWLIQEGYLVIDRPVSRGSAFDPDGVDWTRTRAWADGGYCGRIYLNVRDREPQGVLSLDEARHTRDEIRAKLEKLMGPDGCPLGNAVYYPEEVYAACNGIAPDILLYPGDLRWRCAETLGYGEVYLAGNDTGPDAANHAWDGLFLLADPSRTGDGRVEGAHILDVAPTITECLGVAVPRWMRGVRL
jgi:predicted AlkP superfamily phosphohydrolase/phosphomutase